MSTTESDAFDADEFARNLLRDTRVKRDAVIRYLTAFLSWQEAQAAFNNASRRMHGWSLDLSDQHDGLSASELYELREHAHEVLAAMSVPDEISRAWLN